eukprot:scaffold36127_cov167-Skeletonema_dohrnii-CCMP3373.AAC.1
MSEISNIITEANELLAQFCESESLSEDGLRQIFERHKYPHVNNYSFFLRACINKRVNEGIIQCLLEYVPAAASANFLGQTPLHFVCDNENVTLNIIQLLIDAAPDSVRSADEDGDTPLHNLCRNDELDESAALAILKLLIEKHPETNRANNEGLLPIHFAGARRSPEFCHVLIEACPGSERITGANDMLPLHWACATNTLAMVEYLYKLHPDAINHADTEGYYPIHIAITGLCDSKRSEPENAIDIVKFLLDCNPNVKLQLMDGLSLLAFACCLE